MRAKYNTIKPFAEFLGENPDNLSQILSLKTKRGISKKKAQRLAKRCSEAGIQISENDWMFNSSKIKAQLPLIVKKLTKIKCHKHSQNNESKRGKHGNRLNS